MQLETRDGGTEWLLAFSLNDGDCPQSGWHVGLHGLLLGWICMVLKLSFKYLHFISGYFTQFMLIQCTSNECKHKCIRVDALRTYSVKWPFSLRSLRTFTLAETRFPPPSGPSHRLPLKWRVRTIWAYPNWRALWTNLFGYHSQYWICVNSYSRQPPIVLIIMEVQQASKPFIDLPNAQGPYYFWQNPNLNTCFFLHWICVYIFFFRTIFPHVCVIGSTFLEPESFLSFCGENVARNSGLVHRCACVYNMVCDQRIVRYNDRESVRQQSIRMRLPTPERR